MTSVIVPKKSLNDLIDEELYKIPSNDTLFNFNSPVYQPLTTSISQQGGYGSNGTPMSNHSNQNNNNNNGSGNNNNNNGSNNTATNSNTTTTTIGEPQKIFNDYGNPDQSFIQPNKLLLTDKINELTNHIKYFNQQKSINNNQPKNHHKHQIDNNRFKNLLNGPPPKRRLKTLTPIGKFDDYLFNPNIEPSSSINFNYDNFDNSIFVQPNNSAEILNDINNYIDDDLSDFDDEDDEEDEDEDDNELIGNDNEFDDINDMNMDMSMDNGLNNINELNKLNELNELNDLDMAKFDDINVDDIDLNNVELIDNNELNNLKFENSDFNDLSNELNYNYEEFSNLKNDYKKANVNMSDINYQEVSDIEMDMELDMDLNIESDSFLSPPSSPLDNEDVENENYVKDPIHNPNHNSNHINNDSVVKLKDQTESEVFDDDKKDKNDEHICHLINPHTNKPCNKNFSRPYDLIRHQETIHASLKKIFRCVICEGRLNGGEGNGKSKTFSRGDALSRHIKVKHQLIGKEAMDLINNAKDNVEYVSVNS